MREKKSFSSCESFSDARGRNYGTLASVENQGIQRQVTKRRSFIPNTRDISLIGH